MRGVVSPLFAGVVEHSFEPCLNTIDSKTAENLLFFFDATNQNRSTPFARQVLKLIQEKKWLESALFKDHMLLIRYLQKNLSVCEGDENNLFI